MAASGVLSFCPSPSEPKIAPQKKRGRGSFCSVDWLPGDRHEIGAGTPGAGTPSPTRVITRVAKPLFSPRQGGEQPPCPGAEIPNHNDHPVPWEGLLRRLCLMVTLAPRTEMGPEMTQNCRGRELEGMDGPRLIFRANIQAGDCGLDRAGARAAS